jgi:hypothetical protein
MCRLGRASQWTGDHSVWSGTVHEIYLRKTYERDLYGTAVASGRGFVIFRPAITSAAGKRELRLSVILCRHPDCGAYSTRADPSTL